MKKLVIGTSLALALAATPALAATHHVRAQAQLYGSDAYAAAYSGFVAGGPGVYAGGEYLGWDPDPNVRLDLIRQGNQTQEGGN